MYRFLLAGLLGFCVSQAAYAQPQTRASVSGFVRDATTGETLILANVSIDGGTYGAATNEAGYYTITALPAGNHALTFSYIGYQSEVRSITLVGGEKLRLDIALTPEGVEIDEVVVTAEKETEEELRRVGVARLETDLVRKLPAVIEPDVFRSLQLLPGVKAASDYSSGLYIRGGAPDQTLILLDRTTVYNPTHFFGFFSTFNPDAVKDVRLFKGGYPAQYGGRLGSVVDIYNKDGNRVNTEGSLSLGLLASRAIIEGPYSRGSYMFAARRSTLEPLLAVLQEQDIDGIPESFYFYDFNGKVNLDATPDDKLSVSFYAGRDNLDLAIVEDAIIDLSYGNRTFSTNWTHIFSERWFSNFNVTSSRYFSRPSFEIAGTPIARKNDVYDVSLKGDLEFVPNRVHSISGGFWAGIFTFRLRDTFDDIVTLTERKHSSYAAVYLEDEIDITRQWEVRLGVRANYFDEGGYLRFEPRVSIEHRPMERLRLQLGYGRYYQFLSLVTSELFSGSDIWLTTGENVPPAWGDQYVAGIKTTFRSVDIGLEGFYRSMKDLFELDPLLPDAAGLDYADLFHFGTGFAYGGELMIEKPTGTVTGFVGYTLGITRRRFQGFEESRLFPPKHDRTHDVNLVANYRLTRKWRLTSVFTYATGQAYTRPSSQYRVIDNPLGSLVKNALVSPFNQERLPAYHRLDLGFAKSGRFFGIGDYDLQLQVINAYKRRNVWFYFFEFEQDNSIKEEEIPQIPVPIPSLSLTVKFGGGNAR